MLQQFSWQSFLIAALILTLIWYAGVFVMFYRSQFIGETRFANPIPSQPLGHHWEKRVDKLDAEPVPVEEDLMGKTRPVPGVENLQMGSLGFATEEDRRYDQIGLIPDLIEELKLLFARLAQQQGSKSDFFIGIEQINRNYSSIGSHPGVAALNQFIVQRAMFSITADELDSLWD